MFNRTVFFWKIGVLSLAGSVAAWHMYCTSVPWLDTLPACLLFCIAPFFFSLAHNAIHAVPAWLAKFFAWAGGYWLIFTIYSFMGAVVYGLAWLLCAITGFDWQAVGPHLSAYIRACVLAILVVGSYRALVPAYRPITVETDKIEADTTIAFLSDTHFSPLLSHWFVKGMVRRLQSVGADAVIFGGDLIDAHLDFVRRYGNLLAVVTSGYGFWGTPFRTGPRPEIVVIHLKKSSQP